jgi:serine/threonine protein kinase
MSKLAAEGHAVLEAMAAAMLSTKRQRANMALVAVLKRLARHKADELLSDGRMTAVVEQAVDQRLQELSESDRVFDGFRGAAGRGYAELQRELADLQNRVAGVVLFAERETEWRPICDQRDLVRVELVVTLAAAEARLDAQREQLNTMLANWPTEVFVNGASSPTPSESLSAAADGDAAELDRAARRLGRSVGPLGDLLAAQAELDAQVGTMRDKSSQAWTAAAEIASQLVEDGRTRRDEKGRELRVCEEELHRVQRQLRREMDAHRRRTQAELLLESLSQIQVAYKEAKKAELKARHHHEAMVDSEDEDAELDEAEPDVVRAKEKRDATVAQMEMLARRRDGIQSGILELAKSAGVPPTAAKENGGGEDAAGGGGDGEGEDTALRLDLPELPVRAQRVVVPFKPLSSQMSPRDTRRRHVENMLRRDGLLVNRSYKNYSEDGLPDAMHAATLGKPHVNGRRLRGAGLDSLKILKAIPLDEYKRVKRAVVTAHRLKHTGIVPVECAFVEKDVVVTQSRFYEGGNMRDWAKGVKKKSALLIAAQRIAAAIALLHGASTLHRDIKPGNVVFDGTTEDAHPALCDFDLSLDMRETSSTTAMRGTLLYMAPEFEPSEMSDVFSLGVTLLDIIIFGGDQSKIPTESSVLGHRLNIGAARGGLVNADPLHLLVKEMLSEEASARPKAAQAEHRLKAMIHEENARECPVCMDRFAPDEGLACAARESHFICHGCMSQDIICRQVDLIGTDDLGSDYVFCCMKPDGCDSPAYPLRVIAQHSSPEAFDAIGRRIEDLKRAQMEQEFDQKRKDLEAALLQKSQEALEVLAKRRHIENEIMALRCPKCKLVFSDYSGCAALTCRCKCAFCALCLEDCGADAHRHVRHCKLNPTEDVYITEGVWHGIVTEQRRRAFQAYWRSLADGVKLKLSADPSIRQISADLGEPVLQVQAYAVEIAQLQGMGFVDEGEMVAALRAAEGDVEQAVSALLA